MSKVPLYGLEFSGTSRVNTDAGPLAHIPLPFEEGKT